MLTIRLFRTGKKNQPFFKIVVIDKRKAPKSGRFVEEVGFYNPLTKEKNIKGDRVKYWISVGAAPSDTLHNLLIREKVIEGKKIDVHKEKKEEKLTKPASEKPVIEKKEEKPIETASEKPVIEKKEEKLIETASNSKEPVVEKKEEKPIETASKEPVVEKKEEKSEKPVQEKKSTEEKAVSEET